MGERKCIYICICVCIYMAGLICCTPEIDKNIVKLTIIEKIKIKKCNLKLSHTYKFRDIVTINITIYSFRF